MQERLNYNKVITIKLVIPSPCNCRCSFCYNNEYSIGCTKEQFLNNFLQSIEYLLKEIGTKNEVSLDITGGEPTLDVQLLRNVLNQLRQFHIKEKVLRVTLTTNGLHLSDLIADLQDVVDYVNISTHHFDKSQRDKIFKTYNSPTNSEYKACVDALRVIGITASTCCVLYEPIRDFTAFMDEYIRWCKSVGFIALRFRCDVYWANNEFDDYMAVALQDNRFIVINHENTPDSHWCRLRTYDKFRVFFLHGVKDTSLVTKGIEYVVHDDGIAYTDFGKQQRAVDADFEIGKIYDL